VTLTDGECWELLRRVIREMAPVAPPSVAARDELVGNLGFDSLGVIELVGALEDALEVPPIDDDLIPTLQRVADVERIFHDSYVRAQKGDEAHAGLDV
jgi:acyl carrier protein